MPRGPRYDDHGVRARVFKVGLGHEGVYLVGSRINDTRPIGVAGVDRGKLLWNERDRTPC